MFGLGFWELVILAVAVLVFVPPRRLPAVFYKIGRIYGEIRAFNRNIRATMRSIEREAEQREPRSGGGESSQTTRDDG
ncbi:MAG: Sec-independent protein translocase subunit TatA/TatB [Spirochaetota bacterium]